MKKLIEHQQVSRRHNRERLFTTYKRSMLRSAQKAISLQPKQSKPGRSIADNVDYIIGRRSSLIENYRSKRLPREKILLWSDAHTARPNSLRRSSPLRNLRRSLATFQISLYPAEISFITAVIMALLPLSVLLTPNSNVVTHTFQSAFFSLPLQSQVSAELRVSQEPQLSTILPEEAENDFSKVSYSEFTLSKGDTLSDLAERHNITVSTLASFNKIDNARALQAGRFYRIPDREGLLHVVQHGESLEQIVYKYNADINAILDTNDLPDTAIAPGMELFIPGAALSDWELRLLSGELFSYPVAGRHTSGFGYRRDPFTGLRRFHYGIDLAAPTGKVVRAGMEGIVSYIGNQGGGYGKYIILKHPGGFQTLYAHLNGFAVSTGQSVARGQSIGWIGNTGRSTGSHLHFAIIKNGKFQNPYNYL